MRSATAGEGERELQLTCFHGVKRGITPANGSLHRMVRRHLPSPESRASRQP